jgi:hypothetical protein
VVVVVAAGPGVVDDAVLTGGLPVAGLGGAVGAQPRRVLAVAEAEEVPLVRAQLRNVCNIIAWIDQSVKTTSNTYIEQFISSDIA